MDAQEAKKVLGDAIKNFGLDSINSGYVEFFNGEQTILLDGHFSVRELEAIIWYMKNHST